MENNKYVFVKDLDTALIQGEEILDNFNDRRIFEVTDDDIRALEIIIKVLKNGLSTKELVNLLSQREGVEVINVDPHTEKNITICGPAIALNVID
ncbi:TPA: BC1881 family protein [Clostridium perfringens]|nr:BC1881 family protein [Clostridium perfringens]